MKQVKEPSSLLILPHSGSQCYPLVPSQVASSKKVHFTGQILIVLVLFSAGPWYFSTVTTSACCLIDYESYLLICFDQLLVPFWDSLFKNSDHNVGQKNIDSCYLRELVILTMNAHCM